MIDKERLLNYLKQKRFDIRAEVDISDLSLTGIFVATAAQCTTFIDMIESGWFDVEDK